MKTKSLLTTLLLSLIISIPAFAEQKQSTVSITFTEPDTLPVAKTIDDDQLFVGQNTTLYVKPHTDHNLNIEQTGTTTYIDKGNNVFERRSASETYNLPADAFTPVISQSGIYQLPEVGGAEFLFVAGP